MARKKQRPVIQIWTSAQGTRVALVHWWYEAEPGQWRTLCDDRAFDMAETYDPEEPDRVMCEKCQWMYIDDGASWGGCLSLDDWSSGEPLRSRILAGAAWTRPEEERG